MTRTHIAASKRLVASQQLFSLKQNDIANSGTSFHINWACAGRFTKNYTRQQSLEGKG